MWASISRNYWIWGRIKDPKQLIDFVKIGGEKMGGQGSGRHHYIGARNTTDEYLNLDVRCLQREGLLIPGLSYGCQWSHHGKKIASIWVRVELDQIILTYQQRSAGEEWQDKDYPVRLDWTGCNYGGQRAWFRCPDCWMRPQGGYPA
jgi:hypothetical protein